MIGDRLGVGRTNANVDQRDAMVVGTLEMIGRHLRQVCRCRA
jgi:hypothetical protein